MCESAAADAIVKPSPCGSGAGGVLQASKDADEQHPVSEACLCLPAETGDRPTDNVPPAALKEQKAAKGTITYMGKDPWWCA